jgi:hypothetical protein
MADDSEVPIANETGAFHFGGSFAQASNGKRHQYLSKRVTK